MVLYASSRSHPGPQVAPRAIGIYDLDDVRPALESRTDGLSYWQHYGQLCGTVRIVRQGEITLTGIKT